MTKTTSLVACTAAAVVLPLAAPPIPRGAGAQDAPIAVERIRANPEAHVNQIRTVAGVVDRLVRRDGSENPAYYLEDDYGHQILVIPFEAPPARGQRVRVTGVVTLDSAGDPVLTLFDTDAAVGSRADGAAVVGAGGAGAGGSGAVAGAAGEAGRAGGTSGPGGAVGEPSAGGADEPGRVAPRSTRFGSHARTFWMLGGLMLALAVAGLMYRRAQVAAGPPIITSAAPRDDDVDFATSAFWPESEQQFEGRTMRFVRPDPTARLLPAKLEVVGGGDAGEEIHFVAVEGEPVAMMFGRSSGEGPSHVQLKQKTVSRTHAIVRFRHDEWLLENLSMTNPTVLNDEVLGVKERLLTDGDRIEMGEVTLRFRSW